MMLVLEEVNQFLLRAFWGLSLKTSFDFFRKLQFFF